jgi:hypothetical protein
VSSLINPVARTFSPHGKDLALTYHENSFLLPHSTVSLLAFAARLMWVMKSLTYFTLKQKGAMQHTVSVANFWYIVSCSPYVNRRFGLTYHLHLQGRKSAAQETSAQQMTMQNSKRWYLVRQIFDHEDGGDALILKVGSHTDYWAP